MRGFERKKPARGPLPEHLPRERIVYPAPSACPCCGGMLRKLGEDVTETLEVVPRQWKVIQHVREKLSCRACEAITQPPARSHPIARGRAGPALLAQVLFAKYALHLPLNRQSAAYAREGIDLDVSTLADWVGAAAATLMPLVEAIRQHVFAAEGPTLGALARNIGFAGLTLHVEGIELLLQPLLGRLARVDGATQPPRHGDHRGSCCPFHRSSPAARNAKEAPAVHTVCP